MCGTNAMVDSRVSGIVSLQFNDMGGKYEKETFFANKCFFLSITRNFLVQF